MAQAHNSFQQRHVEAIVHLAAILPTVAQHSPSLATVEALGFAFAGRTKACAPTQALAGQGEGGCSHMVRE